jgi:hypothetical protein
VASDSDGQSSGLSDGETAVLIASDRASAMTGAAANITSGQVVD